MFSIIRKEIQVLLKEKGTFFWLFILPILFIVMFASIFSNTNPNIKIQYIDADHSKASDIFINNLQKVKGFELNKIESSSKDEEIKKIKDGKLSALLVIPQGFEANIAGNRQANIVLYRDATADAVVEPIQILLHNIAGGYREGKIAGALEKMGVKPQDVRNILNPSIVIKEVKENAKKINMLNQIVPGYTVMFVFFIMISISRSFIKEKESGMLSRLRSTPMKPIDYLLGMWVTYIFLVLIQCTTLLAFGHFVYNLGLGDITALSLIIITLAICGTGIGLAMALLVKSENQGVAVTQIFTMGGAALGGLWFPFDLLPATVQTIGQFTPQYWAQRGFQDIMIRGAHSGDVWYSIVILFTLGVIGVVVALARFKKFIIEATN